MVTQIVEKALEEIKTGITVVGLGKIILNSLLVFVIILIFSTVFDFNIYFALVPAILYFIVALFYNYRSNKYLVVESKVPELNEKLRTVADNLNKSNPILDSLKEDVVKNTNKVQLSNFIDYEANVVRILLLAIFSIIIVIVAYSNVNFDFEFGDIPGINILEERSAGQEVVDLNLSYMETNLSGVLGGRSVAMLGVEELQLVINPLESNADLNSVRQVRNENFNAPIFPKEIYTSYDVAYSEHIAKENQKVVRSYFEQIAR